ncbi:hypothetical protein niasHS_018007 [Heterodera schachtii]|uniref:Protein kinase domain-containing protein n=1 Tax=Heterodera schachtii TaxID=97005 RepID=A0ABD2HS75_HETSC
MIKGAKWVTISELGHRDLEEELKKAKEIFLDLEEELSKVREEIKTMLKDIMKPLVEFHQATVHYHYLEGQKKGIVKENFEQYVIGFTAPELLEHLKHAHHGDVEVTPKMDIWSAGLIILQLTLKKTFGYKETDKEIDELFRSAKLKFDGREFKPQPTKLRLPKYFYEFPRNFEFEKDWPSKNWWDNYLTVIHDILTNMLNIDAEKRMSAKGIIDYLEGKCKPKEYEKNAEKMALFGDVIKEDLNKVENIKKNLIKNAVKSIETFLKELDKRAEICDH